MQMAEAFAVRKTDDKKTDNKTWKLPPAGPNAGRRCFSWALPRKAKRPNFKNIKADKKTHAHQKDVRAN